MNEIPAASRAPAVPCERGRSRSFAGQRRVGVPFRALVAIAFTFLAVAFAAPPASGSQGMVASNHPLASLAGMQVLIDGGNAVDAAIATAAALGVVEPSASGLGGDGFMIVHWADGGDTFALNFSGRAPAAADAAAFEEDGFVATEGPRSAVVPGAAAGWDAALERFGSMPLERLLAPAIAYAEEGHVASAYAADAHSFAVVPFLEWGELGARTWWGGGIEPPAVGEVVRNPNLAATYRTLAEEGLDAFYEGEIAAEIAAAIEEYGGLMTAEDLAAYEPLWHEPLTSEYRGVELHTTRPNASGGLAALQILNIVEGFDIAGMEVNSADYVHTFVEATKLAAADRAAWVGDPAFVDEIPLDELLSEAYADERRALIDPERAATDVEAGVPQSGTTHLTIVDRAGNVVSMTSSLGFGWGSGFVAGETGVVLNNAMNMFELDPESPVYLEGGKRPRWNMAPTIVTEDGEPRFALGTPGGTAIWQVLPQVISRMIDHGMDLQSAIDAPRFTWSLSGAGLGLEARVDEAVLEELEARGHEPSAYTDWSLSMGGVNGVVIGTEDGALEGASDPRREGYVIGW